MTSSQREALKAQARAIDGKVRATAYRPDPNLSVVDPERTFPRDRWTREEKVKRLNLGFQANRFSLHWTRVTLRKVAHRKSQIIAGWARLLVHQANAQRAATSWNPW